MNPNRTPSAGKTPTNAKWEERVEEILSGVITDYTGDSELSFPEAVKQIKDLFLERERELIANIRRWLGNGSYPIHDCEEGDCHERLVELLDHMEALSKAQSLLREV